MNDSSKKAIALLIVSSLVISSMPKKTEASNEEATMNYSITMNEEKEIKEVDYTIQKGDTLSEISKKYYGDTCYWKEIALYNNISNPNLIRRGRVIVLPESLGELLSSIYVFDNEETVKEHAIQEGETLYGICKFYYGDTSMGTIWKLATYNNLFNPNYIRKGRKLEIPSYDELENVDSKDYSFCFPYPNLQPCHGHHHRHDSRVLRPHHF